MIDYTKNENLPVCPKCGRHGRKKKHNIKGKNITIFDHKAKIVLGFKSITDRCII